MNLRDIYINQKAYSTDDPQKAWGDFGMTASASKEASQAGADILKAGGNAMDALAAIQFGLAVAEPFNTGLGASGFIMYYDNKTKETTVVQGHSKGPVKIKKNVFVDEDQSAIPFIERSTPGTAVAIPGIIKAFSAAVEKYGTKTWAEVIEPAVGLAEKGVEVNDLWKVALDRFHIRLGAEAKKFFMPDDVPLTVGEIVANKDLAHTLRILQKEGADSFYKGEIADAIIETVKEMDGCLIKEDLQNYQVKFQEPLKENYKGFEIVVPAPPNGGGFGLLYMLKLLEKLQIQKYDIRSWEKYYIIAETLRIMSADKLAYIGDPDFYDIPLQGLLHPDYIDERLQLYNFKNRNLDVSFGNPWKYEEKGSPNDVKPQSVDKGSETTHFIAVDRRGNIAACTSSLEHIFGSGIMVPGYGFLLNNDMTDFDPALGSINSVEPNKYPVSMKTPTMVFKEGRPFLTLGSPGGPTIVASVFQTLINVLDYKMDLKEAIEEPRIYNSVGPLIWWEKGVPEEARKVLTEMNYQFDEIPLDLGNVQAVLFDQEKEIYYGACDSSRPGLPVGLKKEDMQ